MTILSLHQTELPHSPEAIYSLWASPRTWPDWDPDVASVVFDGDARIGAQGRMRPASGPTSTITITAVDPDRRVTTTSRLPGATLTFDHLIEPTVDGCAVEVRISVDGPLAPLWHRLLRRGFASTASRNVEGLSRHLVSQR